jgi:hypothetical protein
MESMRLTVRHPSKPMHLALSNTWFSRFETFRTNDILWCFRTRDIYIRHHAEQDLVRNYSGPTDERLVQGLRLLCDYYVGGICSSGGCRPLDTM